MTGAPPTSQHPATTGTSHAAQRTVRSVQRLLRGVRRQPQVGRAIVVGSGPNGLAAAITLVQRGWQVELLEGASTPGGGVRTQELTLPGYHHDVCSAVHPLAVASPFFRNAPLGKCGLEWIYPELDLAHPFDDGSAAVLSTDMQTTRASLDPADADAWERLFAPLAQHASDLYADFLGPLRIPRHPLIGARFGLAALQSADGLARRHFTGRNARALFSGMAAHSMLKLEQPTTAAIGLMLALTGHAIGWPIPRGGSQQLTNALVAWFEDLGGTLRTDTWIEDHRQVADADLVLWDLTPRQLLQIASPVLPSGYRRALTRYRYGPGVTKLDYALSGPMPWTADACTRASTVHLGGTLEEIAASERDVIAGRHPQRPYLLVSEPSRFDPSRVPAGSGHHTLWVYSHTPSGSTHAHDDVPAIERQIERFAPGFRDLILARHVYTAREMQAYNPNYIGGDINGGLQDIRQLFTRPVPRLNPYVVPNSTGQRWGFCSSATPPGGGVHGMSGYWGVRRVGG